MYHDNELVPPHSLNGQHHGATVTAAVKPSADPGKKRDPCQWTNKKLSFVAESTDSIDGTNEKRNVKKSLTLTALKKAAAFFRLHNLLNPAFPSCEEKGFLQGVPAHESRAAFFAVHQRPLTATGVLYPGSGGKCRRVKRFTVSTRPGLTAALFCV